MSIKVRKAEKSDSAFIAESMIYSSRTSKKIGLFDLMFDTTDNKELLENLQKLVTTETKNYCHFSNFLIAEIDGKIEGTLCGYEPRLATQNILTKSLAEFGFDESYQERISAYRLCEPKIDNKTWVLDLIHVIPEHKSLELLKALVQKSLLTARLKGYRQVQTLLDIGSVETKMDYEKLGFSYLDEIRSDYFAEVFLRPGILRLSMHL
ncbi:MAG: acyl-CoA acyltransferase [Campylobacterota bacterium]|nr:acyl-CoA acyltransferase [Campylobacterota bacterium]